MTTFTLSGEKGGQPLWLTWTDGAVTGSDALAVLLVTAHARDLEGHLTGQPGGPYTMHDHLSSPYTARALMQMVFDRHPQMTAGALPPLPDPPKGAIR